MEYDQVPYSVWSRYAPSTYATWVFVLHSSNWQAWWTSDSNLRWWAGDSLVKDWNWSKLDRQWPCPDGYYVPSAKDLNSLLNEWKDIAQDSDDYEKFAEDLLFPIAWHVKKEDGYLMSYDDAWYLWTSSPARNDGSYRFAFRFDQFSLWGGMQRSSGDPIRCFKNVDNQFVVEPNGWVKAMVSILGNKMIHHLWAPTHPEWKQFLWRYTTPKFLRWTEIYEWDSIDWVSGLYARWEGDEESYIISFVNEDWTELQKIEVSSGSLPSYTGDTPTKTDDKDYTYTFAWWEPEIVAVTWDATYTAKYEAIQKSGKWGGNNLKKDNCPDGDYSDSYYDGECGTPEDDVENDGEWEEWKHESAWDEDEYTNEELSAYEWAYQNGITTMDAMQLADPDGYVIRWHMAKMVVNFMINVLWVELPESIPEECLTLNNWYVAWESEEIRAYAMESCSLWVMWIDMVDNNFLANDIVSRAEFGTILSRILWGDTHNVKHTRETPYYTKHLNELNKNWIITQIDKPLTRKELRKRVWVVLKRISESEINH